MYVMDKLKTLKDQSADKLAKDQSTVNLVGCNLLKLDFESLNHGDCVSNQYQQSFGLLLSTSGGLGSLPHIFDTNNPVTGEYRDSDVGSPNKHCPNGGPGVGEGGEPGRLGQNCNPLGNVLIIQKDNAANSDIPGTTEEMLLLLDRLACTLIFSSLTLLHQDDNRDGGSITFMFETPAEYVSEIGLLDSDYGGSIKVEYEDNGTQVKEWALPKAVW